MRTASAASASAGGWRATSHRRAARFSDRRRDEPRASKPALIDLWRQRELDEDAVERVVAVQPIEQGDELALGRRGGEGVQRAADADLGRGPLVAPRVHLARGIFTDEDDLEPRRAPCSNANADTQVEPRRRRRWTNRLCRGRRLRRRVGRRSRWRPASVLAIQQHTSTQQVVVSVKVPRAAPTDVPSLL